jgi:hypothetical protein
VYKLARKKALAQATKHRRHVMTVTADEHFDQEQRQTYGFSF